MKEYRGGGDFQVVHQKTLRNAIHCTGTGLHTGARVSMVLRPAAAGTGVVFRRTDIRDAVEIPANWRNIADTRMCTTLGDGNGTSVGTVEHLMAALAGCEIDNVLVELDGPEVPVMDGSAEPFVFLIECAGTSDQESPKQAIKVLKEISVSVEGRTATLAPDRCFSITFEIDFDNPVVARQSCSFRPINGTFKSEISRARTFGFLKDVGRLRAAGLARGGSLDNAVVIGDNSVLNAEGLRYEDEFVRHKVLDTIGDLYLAGAPIIGHFDGYCSGHFLNRRLLETLFADETAWCYTALHGEQTGLEDRAEEALRVSA